ncbi:hypothetical protein [Prosthecobacter sp.]|uniref:hypothetical protein n=1 Tax=Prosthecobacter sp. TaxID=1965333 RepID=UPI00248756A9|nr:hypothetical protein [Prosthecobacter sp.]MDI1313751.1 hypothetical protein [Prosthecobacter sp.]
MTQEVYHTATYHYRRLSTLIVGMVCVAFSSFFLILLVPQWVAAWRDPSKLVVGLFPIGISSLFAFLGTMLIRYYLTDFRLELRIDSQGVQYGRRFYPWTEIGSLSGRWNHGRLQLLLHRRGLIALDRYLLTDIALTEYEYDRLMERLNDYIGALYPHFRIG